MVEAAGVEPVHRIANTQVIDSKNGQKGQNGYISDCCMQNAYKNVTSSADSNNLARSDRAHLPKAISDQR
jgi:hypothetical protein